MSEHRGEHCRARRVHISEAAELLGVSKDAVRMRIRRGTMRSEKVNDRVYVWVNVDQERDQDTVHPQAQVEPSEMVEELRDRIAYLERQVEAERKARAEESRELRRLLAGLIERVPQLEPPAEPQGSQESREEPGRQDTSPSTTSQPAEGDSVPLWHGGDAAPEDPPRRPWWRRWFGG